MKAINIDEFFMKNKVNNELDLPIGIYPFMFEKFAEDLESLYCPDLIILPINEEGEVAREQLYTISGISRYGAYENNVEYEGELYNVILVNND